MGSGQAQEIGVRLIDLLTQQRLVCRQLRELAQKQSDLVDGKNPEMLLRVLAGRQRIIDRLAVIDKELKPMRQAWEAVSEGLPVAQRDQAQELVAEVQGILGDIIARDEKDSQTLRSQQQQVSSDIRGTSVGKRMTQAYGKSVGSGGSRYFDTVNE